MSEDKNSNLIIFGLGIAALFFAYLIYIKSKESTLQTPIPTPTPTPVLQPQLIQIPSQQQIQQPQLSNNLELYKISEQLKLQNNQIQMIQEQQARQMENINQIESTKCSNVVSMGNTSYNPMNKLKTLRSNTNVGRENDEYIANNIFGMR